MADAEVLAYLKKHYTYDPRLGKLVRKETGRVTMGANKGCYMSLDIWTGTKVMHFFYHRAVWAVVHGRLPTQIDHINGDKTDNRIENLREVSSSGNNANRLWRWKPNAQTGLPGVVWNGLIYSTTIMGRTMSFQDKHEAFVMAVLCGKMYGEIQYQNNMNNELNR